MAAYEDLVLKQISENARRMFVQDSDSDREVEEVIAQACREYAIHVVRSIHRMPQEVSSGTEFKSVV